MPIVVFVVVVCALVVLAIGGWLIAHLRAQTGEIEFRLDDLLHVLSHGAEAGEVEPTTGGAPSRGMPASSVLNDFALPNLAGTTTTLSQWRGRRVALVFVHPDCPFSRELLRAIADAGAAGERDGPIPVVVSTGDAETNRALTGEALPGVSVALQDGVEVAQLMWVSATPAAYLVDCNGVTEGPLRFGSEAILAALEVARPDAEVRHSSADQEKTTPLPPARRELLQPLPVGSVMPDVEVIGLDGTRLALGSALARRSIVLLVEPDCPACRDLMRWLAALPEPCFSDLDVVVGAAEGDAMRSVASEFALPLAIAPDRARVTARAVGTLASPSAVLLDPGGVVAAPVAVGATAVMAMLREVAAGDAGAPRTSRRRRANGASAGSGDRREAGPLVSVILTTRDRPGFLRFALTCYERQTYPYRELVVVDDGDRYPVDAELVAGAGGRVVRAMPGTPIGTKLNLGLEVATGALCQKMDDDDWYAPAYVETMVTKLRESWRDACRPTVAFVTPFLFFDVARWEIRRSLDRNVPGATFFFRRADWALHRFRPLPGDEDLWFFLDQVRAGAEPFVIEQPELFLAVRHRGSQRERGHTWVNQQDNRPLEDYLLERPLHRRSPEKVLPPWAVAFYWELRAELLAASRTDDPVPARR
jgi:hypothetical protein